MFKEFGHKLSFANVSPDAMDLTETERSLQPLQQMESVASGACVRLLGATVQIGTSQSSESETARTKAWKAFIIASVFGE